MYLIGIKNMHMYTYLSGVTRKLNPTVFYVVNVGKNLPYGKSELK